MYERVLQYYCCCEGGDCCEGRGRDRRTAIEGSFSALGGLRKPNRGRDRGETDSGSDRDSDETFQISRNLGLEHVEFVCILDSQLWGTLIGQCYKVPAHNLLYTVISLTLISGAQTGFRRLDSCIQQKKILLFVPKFSASFTAPPEISGGVTEKYISTGWARTFNLQITNQML